MPRGQQAAYELIAAQRTFNIATVTVGGLFIATHSIVVTVTGTIAGIALCGCSMWLVRRQETTPTDPCPHALAGTGRKRQPLESRRPLILCSGRFGPSNSRTIAFINPAEPAPLGPGNDHLVLAQLPSPLSFGNFIVWSCKAGSTG